MKVYKALADSVVDYAGFAWQSNTSNTNIRKVSRLQNRAIRLITGQYRSSRKESLRLESGIPSIKTRIIRNAVKAVEKSLRLPADHPRRIAYGSASATRNNRINCRVVADKERSILLDEMRKTKPLHFFDSPPWISTPNMIVHSELSGIRRTDTVETKKYETLKRIRSIDASTIIYTDGSAHKGFLSCGSALVVTRGDPEDCACQD